MTISGRVYDIATNKGLPEHIININRKTKGCLLCNVLSEVGKTYSDANGNFSTKITIDTTDFQGTYLIVSVPERAGYTKLFPDSSITKFQSLLVLNIEFKP